MRKVVLMCSSTVLPAARKVARKLEDTARVEAVHQDEEPSLRDPDLVLLLRVTSPRYVPEDAEVVAVPIDGSTGVQNLNTVDPAVLEKVIEYVYHGGERNLENAVKFLLAELFDEDVEHEDPEPTPIDGGFDVDGRYVEDPSSVPSEGPAAAVYVSREAYVWGDLDVARALMNALDSEGLEPVGVFTKPGEGRSLNELLTREDGEPAIDVVLALKKPSFKRGYEEGYASLAELGVPVINAVVSWYGTRDEWRESDAGLPAGDVAYGVALPELQGRVDPVVVGFKDPDGNGFVPDEERCSFAAKRAARWATLRRKPPSERRVAVILNNGVCSRGEAGLGAAMGLDTFESLARLLKRLEEEGYRVDWVPSDGRELEAEFIRRKAFNEFEDTTIRDILEAGGVVDIVPLDKYLEWFEELPEELQERMVETWGEPPGDGMVVDDGLVITGILNGNVFMGVQPKRGCAGAACNGDVCKILHDPKCPPTHHYYAFYRWLRDVFRADVVLHAGTHGTLEWLPGKSVGLSNACWPEVCLGDLPVVYWYVVSNPSEGTQAKRRGYSTLVDHCPPPMDVTEAGTDEIREEIEASLRRGEAPDPELLEELEVRETAFVETGLHVIGETPEDLEGFLFALCRNRLREMIAEANDLDPEEALKDPETRRAIDEKVREVIREVLSGCR